MKSSYLYNYLKIYLWQFLGIGLNLLSMFIVVPRLSNMPSLYGIYSLCIASSVFLSYGDLGFLSAGYKFASESFARDDIVEEIRVVGFAGFVLFCFVLLYGVVMFIAALHPQLLIKNLTGTQELRVATQLLMILAFTSSVIVLQRFMQLVYGIRLEDFIFQRIVILFNIIKIASVTHFFQADRYDIVGYFLFCQMMTLSAGLIAGLLALRRYKYNIRMLLKSFKFSKEVFFKTRGVAFSSLFLMLMGVLFYELDPFVIGRLMGAPQVALYAVGLTLLSYFRAIFGTFYGPFSARFNHFVGMGNERSLKEIYRKVVILAAPVVILPTLTVILFMRPFVYSWVGGGYDLSVLLSGFLVATFIYGFLSYPALALMVAQQRLKILNLIALAQPIFYWSGVALTLSFLGLVAFAFFKLLVFTLTAAVFFYFSKEFLRARAYDMFKAIIAPAVLPCGLLLCAYLFVVPRMPLGKSNLNFVISVSTIAAVSVAAVALYCFFSRGHRELLTELYARLVKA